jgi:hypothetical protein
MMKMIIMILITYSSYFTVTFLETRQILLSDSPRNPAVLNRFYCNYASFTNTDLCYDAITVTHVNT